MSRSGKLTLLIASLLFAVPILAKAPASAPAGSTGLCKDGSYSSASSKSGACSGHGGVKKWYGAAAATSAAAEPAPAKSKAEKPAKPAKAEPRASSPATESAAATGMCKDGTTTSAGSKSGACSGHGGVKDWYAGAAAATAPVASPAAATRAAPATRAAAPAPARQSSAPVATAPGGGNGQVWVNTDSKVYHCQGDQWYGKTKSGSYMSESSAIAQGYHADHGKACH